MDLGLKGRNAVALGGTRGIGSRVPDALQRLFGGAPQSRDLHEETPSRTMDPGSAAHHAAKA